LQNTAKTEEQNTRLICWFATLRSISDPCCQTPHVCGCVSASAVYLRSCRFAFLLASQLACRLAVINLLNLRINSKNLWDMW